MTIKFTDISPPLDLPTWPTKDATTQVTVVPTAYAQALAHLNNHEIEQGGLLIGRAWTNPQFNPNENACATVQIARIEVVEAVPSHNDNATAYSLRMGSEVWAAANRRIVELSQPNLRIIGWFHSHPNLGAFFSATDKATQSAFFNQPYSLGWVIDPFTHNKDRHQAFFLGPQSVPLKCFSL
jgi:proteasome lid subunit RPN8/RPN11